MVSALAGIVLLAWLVGHVGADRIVGTWQALGRVFPVILILTGGRYVLQAAGWRLAVGAAHRPRWRTALAGVVAGESAGYVAGGIVAREPVKLLFVSPETPTGAAIAGAAIERAASLAASTALVVSAALIVGVRAHSQWPAAVAAASGLMATVAWLRGRHTAARSLAQARDEARPAKGHWRRSTVEPIVAAWRHRRTALALVGTTALAQELLNVAEAYLLLATLGLTPAVATVVAFEGANRLANSLGQFVPGRVGVSEATGAVVAESLSLTSTGGLAVALARRARSIVWATAGLALLVLHGAATARERSVGTLALQPDSAAVS